jgi:hypothetical protein
MITDASGGSIADTHEHLYPSSKLEAAVECLAGHLGSLEDPDIRAAFLSGNGRARRGFRSKP